MNHQNCQSRGVYKTYAAHKSICIVYRIIEQEVVVEVIGIRRRADFEVYVEVAKRLLKKCSAAP